MPRYDAIRAEEVLCTVAEAPGHRLMDSDSEVGKELVVDMWNCRSAPLLLKGRSMRWGRLTPLPRVRRPSHAPFLGVMRRQE